MKFAVCCSALIVSQLVSTPAFNLCVCLLCAHCVCVSLQRASAGHLTTPVGAVQPGVEGETLLLDSHDDACPSFNQNAHVNGEGCARVYVCVLELGGLELQDDLALTSLCGEREYQNMKKYRRNHNTTTE